MELRGYARVVKKRRARTAVDDNNNRAPRSCVTTANMGEEGKDVR